VKQEGKSFVESESCIKSIVALHMVYLKVSNFAFDVCKLINVRRVEIITSNLSLKTWQCVLNFETVIFYISFICDFFFLWRVLCIFRVVRQINKRGFTWTASKGLRGLTCKLLWYSLDFIQWQTYSETRCTHCSGEKQNSSKTWINLTSYDTFNQTVKHSVTLLSLCVSGNLLK